MPRPKAVCFQARVALEVCDQPHCDQLGTNTWRPRSKMKKREQKDDLVKTEPAVLCTCEQWTPNGKVSKVVKHGPARAKHCRQAQNLIFVYSANTPNVIQMQIYNVKVRATNPHEPQNPTHTDIYIYPNRMTIQKGEGPPPCTLSDYAGRPRHRKPPQSIRHPKGASCVRQLITTA